MPTEVRVRSHAPKPLLALTLVLAPASLFAQSVSPQCTEALSENARILEEFRLEAEEFGYTFVAQELTAPAVSQASNQLLQRARVGGITSAFKPASGERLST